MLLGLSGASFLVGLTLYSPFFYLAAFLLLALGYLYALRRQATVCSIDEQKRNRWMIPIIMSGIMTGSFLLLTLVVSPLLTPAANARLSRLSPADKQELMDMPGMSSAADQTSAAIVEKGDRPIMAAAVMVPSSITGSIHRADLIIDKMT